MAHEARRDEPAIAPRTGRRPSVRPLVAAGLVAALLGLAELPFAAFMADDLFQLGALERISPATWIGPLNLYTLSDGVPEHVRALQDVGALPWFFDRDFKMAFFRPLSSALLAADHSLWGLAPIGYRLQGALWFVALVIASGLVLRRALAGSMGTLALFLFTISAIHGSLFWNATRHIAIAGALGMAALAAHLRWRESGWRPGRALSIAGFALSLAAGEAAFAVIPYLLAYEGLAAPGRGRERLRALAPVIAMIAVYLALYRFAELGTVGGGYSDPLRAPGAFLAGLPSRWLFLCGALLAGGHADLWVLRPDLRSDLTIVAGVLVLGMALLLSCAWSSASYEDRRGSRWLLAGGAAAMVPFVGAPMGARCLVIPMLGGSVAIAFVLQRWWRALWQRPGLTYRMFSAGCVLLVAIHVVIAPLARLAAPYVLRSALHDRLAIAMAEAEVEGDAKRLSEQRVVVLRAPDFIIGLHSLPFRWLHGLGLPRSWQTLSWASGTHRYARTGAATIELTLLEGHIDAPRLLVGDIVAIDGMRATVLERVDGGPTRVEFAFDRPLDDPNLAFVSWRDDRLRRVALPPVGGHITS